MARNNNNHKYKSRTHLRIYKLTRFHFQLANLNLHHLSYVGTIKSTLKFQKGGIFNNPVNYKFKMHNLNRHLSQKKSLLNKPFPKCCQKKSPRHKDLTKYQMSLYQRISSIAEGFLLQLTGKAQLDQNCCLTQEKLYTSRGSRLTVALWGGGGLTGRSQKA